MTEGIADVSASSKLAVHRIVLTPEFVGSIPEQERLFMFALGHIANELHILRKLVLVSGNFAGDSEVEQLAQASQTMLLIKIFSSKVWAGFEFFRKHFGLSFFRAYKLEEDLESKNLLKDINRYFNSRDCLLDYVRNKFSSHYDPDEIGKARIILDNTYYYYMSDQQGNSLYGASEELINYALLDEAPPGGLERRQVMDRIIDETNRAAGWLTDLVQIIQIRIFKKYGWTPTPTEPLEVPIADGQNLKLPFFLDMRRQFVE